MSGGLRLLEDGGGACRHVDVPTDAYIFIERNWLILNLRSDWAIGEQRYRAGVLLVIDIDLFLAGSRDFVALFEPTPTCFLQHFQAAGNVVAFKVLDNVRSRILLARHQNGSWQVEPVSEFPDMATIDFYRLVEDDIDWLDNEPHEGETFVISLQSSIMPPSLWLTRFGYGSEMIKQAPTRFDAAGVAITQHHAVSVDDTQIPYFQVLALSFAFLRKTIASSEWLMAG